MNFKQKILLQVYLIWFGRLVTKPFSLKALGLVVTLYLTSWWVSWRNVANNAWAVDDWRSQWNFWSGALLGTDRLVQACLGVMALLSAGLVWDYFKRSKSQTSLGFSSPNQFSLLD